MTSIFHLTGLPVALRIGTLEIILIVVIVLVLFGGSKLAGVGKSLGKSIREFKEEMGTGKEKDAEPRVKADPTDDNKIDPDPPASV